MFQVAARWTFPIVVAALNFLAFAYAGPLEDGNAAYVHHDYATAMRILRPLAIQGDGMASTIVGLMYYNNFGAPLDYVAAYMWFDRAATKGNSLAKFMLSEISKKMTPVERARIHDMAPDWVTADPSQSFEVEPEKWECTVKFGERNYNQEWILANGRARAPQGKNFFRINSYSDEYIIATNIKRDKNHSGDPITTYLVIEMSTGKYLELDNNGTAVLGKAYDNVSEPGITTGICKLASTTASIH